MKISKYNIDQLEDEINAQEQQVDRTKDYKDIMYLDALYDEAYKRGYKSKSYKIVELSKGDE